MSEQKRTVGGDPGAPRPLPNPSSELSRKGIFLTAGYCSLADGWMDGWLDDHSRDRPYFVIIIP